ncbi:MAG: adenosyl-hopene transferase HpnH [Elusimicrobia bacterium]|nr:adenosyl-hopene transferase HpnH [Elusimicrobiota bacterium]
MPAPIGLQAAVLRHVVGRRIAGTRRFPLVLMLEPLFGCNLACRGCGKIQYPPDVMRRMLSPEECWKAAAECGAPVVAVAGGEPLIHPEIGRIVEGLIDRGRYVHLCTNALLLEGSLEKFRPSSHLVWSVHLDGGEEVHDRMVGRKGAYQTVTRAIREALARGHRVMTNTTVFVGGDPELFRRFFDDCMALGIDGMIISPGYAYDNALEVGIFLDRSGTQAWFRETLRGWRSMGWDFNHSPYYLDFLEGKRDYECMPWGNPLRHVLGWQRPCYLMSEGAPAPTYRELLESTPWERYGRRSGHPSCSQCMAHVGYEPAAVLEGFASVGSFFKLVKEFMSVKRSPRKTANAETAVREAAASRAGRLPAL